MKKYIVPALSLLLVLVWTAAALAVVTARPSLVTVARGTQTVRVVQYTFNTISGEPRFVSNEGVFIAGNTVLGRTTRTVSATLRATPDGPFVGTVPEQLIIPETVVRRAEQLGINRFQFQRTFVEQTTVTVPTVEIVTLDIAVTTAGGGPLNLTGIRLYFENNRGNITVKRNRTALSAKADLDYTGTGFLRAYWLVDGRILSYVNRYLSSGRRITLETPEVPGLPTFREGSHTVRLIVQAPEQDIPFPKAIYYVTSDRSPTLAPVNLTAPAPQAVENYAPFRVAWTATEAAATYLVEFFLEEEDRPIFSAYTAANSAYVLPEPALRYYFAPGRTYQWQVKAFDKENSLVGESDRRTFRLQ
jgi:hypothetical protein